MCNKAALMREGQILSVGPVDDILEEYHVLVHGSSQVQAGTRFTVIEEEPPPSSAPEVPVYAEESIENVGVEDRLSRATGDVWFSTAVALDDSGKCNWSYFQDQSVTFRFGYEVRRPVRDLVLIFRLLQTSGSSEFIVTERYEILSSERLQAGTSALALTIRGLKLLPNEYSVYVWLGRCDQTVSYDVIDANIALPKLVVKSTTAATQTSRGVAPLSYDIQKLDLEISTPLPLLEQKADL